MSEPTNQQPDSGASATAAAPTRAAAPAPSADPAPASDSGVLIRLGEAAWLHTSFIVPGAADDGEDLVVTRDGVRVDPSKADEVIEKASASGIDIEKVED